MSHRPGRLALLVLLPLVLAACDRGSPPVAAPAAPAEAGVVGYTCPMHPSVQQPGPGSCPLCGMTLTPVTAEERASGAVRVDAARRERFGIATEPVGVRPFAQTLSLPAVVGWDADGLSEASARVSGWVQDPTAAVGDPVRSGQVLLGVFSPELVAAQDDLLRAQAQVTQGDPTAAARRDGARTRLIRAGVAAVDVDAVLAEGRAREALPVRAPRGGVVLERAVVDGAMVGPGQALYRIGDLSSVWLEGAVPEEQLGLVRAGQAVTVRARGLDGARAATVDRVLPGVDPTTRTARVRVRVDNADGALRPEQWATLEVAVDAGAHLAVPDSAVVHTGVRTVVFVDAGDDRLVPREVQLGLTVDGWVQVLGGLEEGEAVVRAGTFLVAADSRLKQGGEMQVAPAEGGDR